MTPKLNIPVLKDDAVLIAETKPQKIQQALRDFKAEHPLELVMHMRSELETLNSHKISAGVRLQALDSYRPFIISTTKLLNEDYINSALPLQDTARNAATAAESLWSELGHGYKLALIDLQTQLIKLGTEKNSALAIHRAIHAISEHALVLYQTYVIPPSHIWSDLHQLYLCAVQLGVHKLDMEAELGSNQTSISTLNTIENAYKHALLMSLAEPQQLIQQDISLVAAYLTHHIKLAFISRISALQHASGTFVINLGSNKPPTHYNKQKEELDPRTDILLQTIDLVFTIHQDLKDLQNKQRPKNGSIPGNGNRNNYIELLTHLIKNWGIAPKRVFSRSLKNGDIDLVKGILAIHRIISIASSGADPKTMNELKTLNPARLTPSRWKILNISASGMAMRRHHTAEKNITLGALVSIKANNEANWSIGFVRWANCGTRDRLDIGIELIAPQARVALARIEQHPNDEHILLLPEIGAINQPATIVAPRGTYDTGRLLTITHNNTSQQVTLTRLVERSHFVERMQYSVNP